MIIDGLPESKNIIDERVSSSILNRIYLSYEARGFEGVNQYLTYQDQGKKDRVRIISFFLIISIVFAFVVYLKYIK